MPNKASKRRKMRALAGGVTKKSMNVPNFVKIGFHLWLGVTIAQLAIPLMFIAMSGFSHEHIHNVRDLTFIAWLISYPLSLLIGLPILSFLAWSKKLNLATILATSVAVTLPALAFFGDGWLYSSYVFPPAVFGAFGCWVYLRTLKTVNRSVGLTGYTALIAALLIGAYATVWPDNSYVSQLKAQQGAYKVLDRKMYEAIKDDFPNNTANDEHP